VPIFVEQPDGILVNATIRDDAVPLEAALRAPESREALMAAQAELEVLMAEAVSAQAEGGGADEGVLTTAITTAIALPADPMLWALALTGLTPDDLVCVEEGA
jgi:hypothetical protein